MIEATTASTPVNLALAQEIERRRVAFYEPKTAPYARRSHYPSDLSPCARQMTYKRVMWDALPKTTVELQERFAAGNAIEERIGKELVALGFDLVAAGTAMNRNSRMEQYGISGKLDRVFKFQGKYVLVEIKSVFPNKWKYLNTLEDMQNDKFLKRYIRQLQIYLFAFEIEQGLFILDDCMGHWKMIPVTLDYAQVEAVLKTVELANQHIKTWEGGKPGTLPERIEYGQECQICPFAMICLDKVVNAGAEILESKEWEGKLNRHEALRPMAKEYKSLHDEVIEAFSPRPQTLVGDYFVTSKETKKGHKVEIQNLKKPEPLESE